MKVKLRICYCGSTNFKLIEYQMSYAIRCKDCGMESESGYTIEEAVNNWNDNAEYVEVEL